MHELSLASHIWDSVTRAARRHGAARVQSITLEIGALNLIEPDQLTFWLKALADQHGSPDIAVNIKTILPARVHCNDCGADGEPALPPGPLDHFLPPPMACRACGSRDLAVTGGRELRVVSAEIEKDEPAADAP